MEKTLNLYKIPAHDSILNVLTDSVTPPATFKNGDYYLNSAADTLYKANGDSFYGGTWGIVLSPSQSMYYRVLDAPAPKFFSYNGSVFADYDVTFPANGRKAEIYDFTYSSQRMGQAPKISATLMYGRCLDDEWTDRVCTLFNGTFFFIDKTPTSSKDNSDERYKHDLSFVSEKILLENVYFLNIADPNNPADIVNDMTEFNFFGDINFFVDKFNRSLEYSRLGLNGIGFHAVIDNDQYTSDFIAGIEEPSILFDIKNTYLKQALDMIFEKFGVPYYYDGYTIHIGFSNNYLAQSAGVTLPEYEYGIENHLLSIDKQSTTDSIVNRTTGRGSSDNIPYFYPNDNPKSLDVKYWRSGSTIANAAEIVNPYKTSNLSASTQAPTSQDGSYFEYKQHLEQYNLKQAELRTPVYTRNSDGKLIPVVNDKVFMHFDYETWIPFMSSGAQPFGSNGYVVYSYSNTQGGTHSYMGQVNKFVVFRLPETEISTYNVTFDEDDLTTFQIFSTSNHVPYLMNVDYDRCLVHADVHINLLNPSLPESVFESEDETYKWILASSAYNSGVNVFNDYWWNTNLTGHAPNVTTSATQYWQSDAQTEADFNDGFPLTINNISNQYKRIGVWITYYIIGGYDVFQNQQIPADNENQNLYTWEKHQSEYTAHLKVMTNTQMHIDLLANRWMQNGSLPTLLSTFGIRLAQSTTPALGDIIYFTASDSLPYMTALMPYTYRDTGDIWYNARNNTYPKTGNTYYSFENQYVFSHAKEQIKDFDIKPTIKGIVNTDYRRIDKFRAIAFDQNDNNDVNDNGEPQHPYFYVKLAKTKVANGYGFNLFNCAIDSGEMTINMTSGQCGGGSFKVKVKTGKDGFVTNTIGLFTQATTINGITYPAGTPKRNLTTGDIITDCPKEDAQQDTENNEVWIALEKDSSTFSGQTLPQHGLIDITTDDTFVITNILYPKAYIVAAEKKLEKALLDGLEEDNVEKFSFSINYSRAYYERHYAIMDRWINEASMLKLKYNTHTFSYYVSSYTYKMASSSLLPEVSLSLDTKVTRKKVGLSDIVREIAADQMQEIVTPAAETQPAAGSKSIETRGTSKSFSSEYSRSIKVDDDVVFQNGRSLIEALNDIQKQINTLKEDSASAEKLDKLEKKVDTKNLFADGQLKYDKNKIEDFNINNLSDAEFSFVPVEGEKKNKLVLTASEPTSGGFTFGQKIGALPYSQYTISFDLLDMNLPEDSSYVVDFYDENDEYISSSTIAIEDLASPGKKTYLIETPNGCSYFCFGFDFWEIDDAEAFQFGITDIMVLEGIQTELDADGNEVLASDFTDEFYKSEVDEDLADQKIIDDISAEVGGFSIIALSGTQDGSNGTFTAASAFKSGTSNLFLNGQRLELTTDYTETSSTTISISTYKPYSTDKLSFFAQKI